MVVETKKGNLPVRYGMNALALYGDLTNKPMNDVMKSLGNLTSMKLSEVLAFIYVGFVDGARYAKEECKVASTDEVGDMLDDDPELMNKMIEAYSDQAPPATEGGKSKKD